MTGPKLNEKSRVAGESSGTKATAKYIRASASKAREVLDLIRGLDVRTADQVLQFTERHIARDVRKVLASAVANAVKNDLQEPEELYVVACFADEGPTLRRFRPRARGRATRINKRTCHITVIVTRMSDERIAILQGRDERAGGAGGRGRPQSSAASRRARVERSRQREAAEAEADAEDTTDESVDEVADAEATEAAETPEGLEPGAYPGSVQPLEDAAEVPEGYEIKGNEGSMLYHEPGTPYYRATKAEVWFDSVESAEAAGFSAPGAKKTEAAEETEDAADADASAESEEESETAEESPDASADAESGAEGSASDEAHSDEENQRADEEEK